MKLLRSGPVALLLLSGCLPSAPPPPAPEEDVGLRWMDVEVAPSPPVDDALVEFGENLYGWYCLPCHGPDGAGDGPNAKRLGLRPRDFTRGLFRFKTSVPGEMPFDSDLYRTISAGIPAAFMPGFTHLSPKERWAIIAHFKTLASAERPDGTRRNHFEAWPARTPIRIPPGPPTFDPRRAAGLYASACASCHGPGGAGDGPASAALQDSFGRPISVPDLRRGAVTFKAGSRAEDLFRVLTAGMPGTPMPSFASLPESDRWNLAYHVVSLYRSVPLGEKLFFRSGCVNCHTIGKGRHLGPDLAGVGARRERAWLRRWIEDPEGLIATDPEARRLVEEYGAPMPAPDLDPPRIDALVEFLGTLR